MSVRQQVEHVLVVATSLFHDAGHFQGFCSDAEAYLSVLLDPAYTSYRPRDQVEEDPAFKQLIPYCVFCHEGRVFHYRRGNRQGESRLHSLRSIGVGGHISSLDDSPDGSPYRDGLQREINEEVYLETTYSERCVGLINDDETPVGKVHLGIVHVFHLDEPKVRPREKSMMDTGFALPAELLQHREELESWSCICLEHLFQA